jgi:hypothetical protein
MTKQMTLISVVPKFGVPTGLQLSYTTTFYVSTHAKYYTIEPDNDRLILVVVPEWFCLGFVTFLAYVCTPLSTSR